MKKRHLAIALIATLISTQVFAASEKVNAGYYSSINLHGHTNPALSNGAPPATDITVVDSAGAVIHAVVPNSPINDTLTPAPPYNVDHIYNDIYSGNTFIQLTDVNGSVFYGNYVWSRAVLNVSSDGSGHFAVTEIA